MFENLLTYLQDQPEDGYWHGWQIKRIAGSANNLLYRATNEAADWAVKFTIRDQRRRAWREYHALLALQEAGISIAPLPLFLDETAYVQPVVVQTWCEGEVTAVPPTTDAEWHQLLTIYCKMAAITPEKTSATLANALINFSSVAEGLQAVQTQMGMIPVDFHPPELNELRSQLKKLPYPQTWASCPRALCHVDGNTLNFLRRPSDWIVVDWENSGWGDPAFEMIDLMCHPKFAGVPMARWEWVMHTYAAMTGDETAVMRMKAYYPLKLVWWVARLARMLYDIPRGKDQRLVPPAPNWKNDFTQKLQRYIDRATAVLAAI